MKTLVTLTVLLCSVVAFAQNQQSSKPDPVKVLLRVEGMTCGGCASSVRSSLSQVKGVQRVLVSLKDAQAKVDFDANQAPVQALAQAVEQAGGARHMFRAALLLSLDGVKDKAAADRVQAALQKVPGVRTVAVSVEKKQATIEFAQKGSATLKQLTDAVQKSGYKVRLTLPEKKEANNNNEEHPFRSHQPVSGSPRVPCCP